MTTFRSTCSRALCRAYLTLHQLLAAPRMQRLAATRGQGTVEYVGIVIVIGVLLVALKTGVAGKTGGDVGKKIAEAVSGAIDDVMKQQKG